ncbi:WD repeat-containing protein 18-like [Diadema antillarum]|uniref:WD repeat-containing protein 18-like n=1 Tax=Diadema antillarum TaxID=105358 RepID=UPI003A844C64
MEALLTTDTSGQLWTASLCDHFTGTSLATFKSGYSCERSICVSKDRLVIASKDRPILSVWDFRAARKDGQPQRQTCPGVVTALEASPDSTYIAAGIAEKVHIWQLTTGMLVAVLTSHYQTVTKIRFSDDGSHLVTASRDNLVLVWAMSEVVRQCTLGRSCNPLHVISAHSLTVTDLFVGAGGPLAHFISSSLDHSCKVWELCTGQLLCNLLFDAPVESVTADASETCLFGGCSDGSIYLVYLFPENASQERHITPQDSENTSIFKGHSASVTCLSVSMDGTTLASGSTDQTARVWDIGSGQCLRVLQHKGSVGAVQFVLRPLPTAGGTALPRALPPLPAFQRSFPWEGESTVGSTAESGYAVKISRPLEESEKNYEEAVGLPRSLREGNAKVYQLQSQPRSDDEVRRLQRINAQLYHLYAQTIMGEADIASSNSDNEH